MIKNAKLNFEWMLLAVSGISAFFCFLISFYLLDKADANRNVWLAFSFLFLGVFGNYFIVILKNILVRQNTEVSCEFQKDLHKKGIIDIYHNRKEGGKYKDEL
jgi:RsiW-degrading membrane proteinase PrsW (M82 family)